jgi:hypothetical protein
VAQVVTPVQQAMQAMVDPLAHQVVPVIQVP